MEATFNTSNPVTTHSNLFGNKEAYLAFVKRWKELARAKQLTREDCLLRCVLLGQDIDTVLPVTKNRIRLENGAARDSGRFKAVQSLANANPVNAYAARLEVRARHTQRGTVPREWELLLSWGERWVDPATPKGLDRGLALDTFQEAILRVKSMR